jgi:hypothetical protein
MLKFTTTTPFSCQDAPESIFKIRPLVIPQKGCCLSNGDIKGNNAYIVGRALDIAGFYLPCFFDGDITELDNPNGNVFMVLPCGTYRIKVCIDFEKNYLLDLL